MEKKSSACEVNSLPVLRAVGGGAPLLDRRAGRKISSPFRDRPHAATREYSQRIALPAEEVGGCIEMWLRACEFRHSRQTIVQKIDIFKKLVWFIENRQCDELGTREIYAFLAHVKNGHLEPGGRWGNPRMTQPVRPVRVRGIFNVLRAWCNFLVRQDVLDVSPMATIEVPPGGGDHRHVFSDDDVRALLRACNEVWHPRREKAIIWVLYDTGIRAGELCGLRMCDFNRRQGSLRVLGKGDKWRIVGIGEAACGPLWDFLRECPRESDAPIFQSDTGKTAGKPLSVDRLSTIIRNLGKRAALQGRCCPHMFRHTFATNMLQNGADIGVVQSLLGHSTPYMTLQYNHTSEAKSLSRHHQLSPGNRLAGL